MIKANDPTLRTWVPIDAESEFPIQNIPFGIFKPENRINARAGTRIGDYVIDLAAIADKGYFREEGIESSKVFSSDNLNGFMELGRPVWRAVRGKISEIFQYENEEFWNTPDFRDAVLFNADEVEMLMPVQVGDYTDFNSSIEHATNVGKMFRDPKNALLPNWKHIPVGYHGRASSIVVSGTDIHRPLGQTMANEEELPKFGPTRRLDFELEMAFITGRKTNLGNRITTEMAPEYIFGLVLFNDLSARDIQKWEYIPLGPFQSKNFGSVISPWVVTLDALEPFKVEGPQQSPPVLPYLEFEGIANYDINLDVCIQPLGDKPGRVSRSNFRYMYWNMLQQLTHQSVSGCNINVGDMYASGAISGPTPSSSGSMLELSWNGTRPLKVTESEERTFIEDNDTIIMTGYAQKDNLKIGFGEVRTKILPAIL